ncbi:hypothetical protein ABTX61_33385 [Amycolatopsis japonica]|uniref:hypothetical protein n=1 Tax=Amycolatopsis japonica TaxID=208439 RepID=UPI00332B9878
MTFSSKEPTDRQEAAARSLVEQVRVRAAMNRAVGILRVWRSCDRDQARDHLRNFSRPAAEVSEADRLATIVDGAADRRTDPELRWD